jgi:thiol-disulfide isomerase/thioredoxin
MEFFHGTWEEALAEANHQGKLIFIDCYTTWCGPCKRMSKYVFPDPDVGEFYNANFINLKLDMEKSEGLEFRRNYPVSAYPTFYYIDSKGEIVYTTKGARDASGFIDLGKTALAKYDGSKQYEEAYNAGDRDYDLVFNYVKELNRASKPSLKVANDYLVSDPDITEEQRLLFIREAATQVDSKIFTMLEENEKALIRLIGQEAWDETIRDAAQATAERAEEYESPSLIDQAIIVMERHLPAEAEFFKQRTYLDYAMTYRQADMYMEYAKPFVRQSAQDNADELQQVSIEIIRYFPHELALVDIAEKAIDRSMRIEKSMDGYMTYIAVCLRKDNKEKALELIEEGLKFAEENKLSDKGLQLIKQRVEKS